MPILIDRNHPRENKRKQPFVSKRLPHCPWKKTIRKILISKGVRHPRFPLFRLSKVVTSEYAFITYISDDWVVCSLWMYCWHTRSLIQVMIDHSYNSHSTLKALTIKSIYSIRIIDVNAIILSKVFFYWILRLIIVGIDLLEVIFQHHSVSLFLLQKAALVFLWIWILLFFV